MNLSKKTSISPLLYVCCGLLGLLSNVSAQTGGFQDPNINSLVHSVALQQDGKIVIGGAFSSVSGQPRTFVARVNSDGTLDTTFQTPVLSFQGVFVVAIQPDGKVLAGGDFRFSGEPDPVYLARFNQDGTRDVTFNAGTNGIVWAVVPQPDGKIFIGGDFVTVSGQARNRMARLNADGSLDTSFFDPVFISTSGIQAAVYAIAPTADGKVVVGGYFNLAGGQARTAVAQLNSDGTLDSDFQDPALSGGTGTTTNHHGTQTIVNSLAPQPDGKLLIGGAFNTVSAQPRSNLVRLNGDGSPDASFQPPVLTNFSNTFLKGIALQPDGRVLIVGYFNSVGGQPRGKGARLNPDGTLDDTFVDPAVSDGFVQSVVLQPDGKVLIGGAFSIVQGRVRRALTRFTSTGALDLPGALEFTVTKTADTNDGSCDSDCSLREAIAAANTSESDDTIRFDPNLFGTARTISLTLGQLAVCNNGRVIINGTGPEQLVVSGSNQSRVLRVFPGGSATLNDLTIADGNATFGPFTGCPAGGGSDASAGGAGVESAGTLAINNSVIRNNVTTGGAAAGGISNSFGRVTITNSTIRDNRASSNYGGIGNFGFGTSLPVTMTLVNSHVTANEAMRATSNGGGGIGSVNRATMSLINSTVTNNTSAADGGGIRNTDAVLTIWNSSISANTAARGGGAIANEGTGTVELTRSTINGNTASMGGGGIRNFGSTLTITNSTISGNSASEGGGIFGPVTLLSATVAFNRANNCGGICAGGETTARNSIVGSNIANTAPDFSGELTSLGYNLIGNPSGMTITGGPEDLLAVDPRLGAALANNGGLTLTHALRTGSPAIDKGGPGTPPLTTDQRGLLRPYDFPAVTNAAGGDGSDIGAFERQAFDVSGIAPFDYDADGRTDFSVFRPSEGAWYLQKSTEGFFGMLFGFGTDKITPADFDGDGKTDIAVFRPSDNRWYIVNSADGTHTTFVFGLAEDIPVPADYDGDGLSDLCMFRPSDGTWYIQYASGGFFAQQFGANGDKPTVGDFDGDGKSDLAVFRVSNGEWYQLHSSDGSIHGERFGFGSDKLAYADYDGDGKTDLAIFRPSERVFYLKNSATSTYSAFVFGLPDDIPTPGDYDGDGRADLSVFRPSDGHWYRQNSSDGSFNAYQFGVNGDRPTPTAFY